MIGFSNGRVITQVMLRDRVKKGYAALDNQAVHMTTFFFVARWPLHEQPGVPTQIHKGLALRSVRTSRCIAQGS